MPISGPGSSRRRTGFTLIEVMVVLTIVAIAAGLISLTIRDPAESRLEIEAARLAALLETARTEARVAGASAVWVPDADARGTRFRFVGLPAGLDLPTGWLDEGVSAEVVGGTSVTLGPEAILPRQRIVLRLDGHKLEVGTDGLAAFAVVPAPAAP